MAAYAKRGTLLRRVRFLIETPDIRLTLAALAHLLRCRINLAELYELVVCLAAYFGNESALVADILRFGALEVAAVAHFAHEAETLRAAGKTANKRG